MKSIKNILYITIISGFILSCGGGGDDHHNHSNENRRQSAEFQSLVSQRINHRIELLPVSRFLTGGTTVGSSLQANDEIIQIIYWLDQYVLRL